MGDEDEEPGGERRGRILREQCLGVRRLFNRAVVHALPFVMNRRGGDVFGGQPLDSGRFDQGDDRLFDHPALGLDADGLEAVGVGLVARFERRTTRQVTGEPGAQRLRGGRKILVLQRADADRERGSVQLALQVVGLRRASLGRAGLKTRPDPDRPPRPTSPRRRTRRSPRSCNAAPACIPGPPLAARAAMRWR